MFVFRYSERKRGLGQIANSALVFFASLHCVVAGLDKYSQLIVADAPGAKQTPATVRVTYLGVNGYQFEAGGHALLVDPYFTRARLNSILFRQPIQPNDTRIKFGLGHVRTQVDAILVTHAHFDHLLDVPQVAQRTNARVITGATAANFAVACGLDRSRCLVVEPGATQVVGPWRIRVLPSAHDRIFGWIPFGGTKTSPLSCPRKASDWRLGEPMAFLIEANGKRIYIDSGGTPDVLPPAQMRPVDLAIVGVALPDSRKRLRSAIEQLRAKYVLPSHQDDFFSPLERGFVFGKLTDFPTVLRLFQRHQINSRLVLLDYFRPWTIR